MQNQAMLLVSDMGLEIPVPSGRFLDSLPSTMIPVHNKITMDIGGLAPNYYFEIKNLRDGNYELDKSEFLREALEWFYKETRAPILSRMIDTSGMDISNAQIKSCTVSR